MLSSIALCALLLNYAPCAAAQDLEITKGYIPGYDGALGHEFVGEVAQCKSAPKLVGGRPDRFPPRERVSPQANCPAVRMLPRQQFRRLPACQGTSRLSALLCHNDLSSGFPCKSLSPVCTAARAGTVHCSQLPALCPITGQRVAGEINCNLDKDFSHPDAIFARNHAPKRTVLGIIAKDGCMAEYITLPVKNLHKVRVRLLICGLQSDTCGVCKGPESEKHAPAVYKCYAHRKGELPFLGGPLCIFWRRCASTGTCAGPQVPEELTDQEAAFCEPLAAACRIVEQQVRLF